MEFRLLKADEMEARIARITAKGVHILIYKDARCDQNILDETVGMFNWQRHHSRDNANCIVSIYDQTKKQWIEKEDTGTESNTEKEKGLASDSFKRACFNWGIGRELYTAPFIWFNANECNINNDKCYDKFAVIDVKYDGRKIESVRIVNQNTKTIKEFKNLEAVKRPSEKEIKLIEEMIVNTNSDRDKFLKYIGITNIDTMDYEQYGRALKSLNAKKEKLKKQEETNE